VRGPRCYNRPGHHAPLSSGARLSPYEILAAIGAGSMGEAYKARETRLDRTVAIKVLPPEFASDAERLTRFEREAKATAALSHPNILVSVSSGAPRGSRPRCSTAVACGCASVSSFG